MKHEHHSKWHKSKIDPEQLDWEMQNNMPVTSRLYKIIHKNVEAIGHWKALKRGVPNYNFGKKKSTKNEVV